VTICENRSDVFRYAWFYGRVDLPDEHFSYIFRVLVSYHHLEKHT